MAEAEIPVDLFNPGQVFACLGFLEAADILLEDVEGGFDWSSQADVKFVLRAKGERNPVEHVLNFLAETQIESWGPVGYKNPVPKKGGRTDEDDGDQDDERDDAESDVAEASIVLSKVFPDRTGDRMSLPIRLGGGNQPIVELGHWADGSSRNNFKLYAGNRSAHKIARAMLKGVRKKLTKKQKARGAPGDLVSKGIKQLWEDARQQLVKDPLNQLTPIGGRFNFDPRGAWTAIDAGYSPDRQNHQVTASPVVEFLAAWGLENARPREISEDYQDLVGDDGWNGLGNSRPREIGKRLVGYAAWGIPLRPILARAAFCGALTTVPLKHFRFELKMSGKNKVVTFAEMEPQP